jgi:hypothetical protein
MMRRLLPLVGVVIALTATAQKATANNDGLTVTGYAITDVPPIKNATTYQQCGTTTAAFINTVYEYDPIGDCGTDMFMAHYTGTINIPAHNTIEFWLASDDGGTIKIGTDEWGNWYDQGCTATESGPLQIAPGPQQLDAWFYENGGGTCFMLAWNIDGQGWEIIQPDAFTRPTPATTTTTSTTTTTTSSTSTTTTTTTTTTAPPATTTPATTYPATTTAPTTTTINVPPSTAANTTSTQPPAPQQTTTTTTTSTTTLAPPPVTNNTIDEAVLDLLTTAQDIPQAEVQKAITAIIDAGVNDAEAQQLATTPAVLEAATTEQAAAIFEAINEDNLTIEQATAIAEAVQNAPDNVRQEFEAAINIFSGKTDNYTAVGSRVPVRTRRIIIITTALLVAVPAPQRKTTT